MMPALTVVTGAATHAGLRRELNEDAFLATAPVFVVADGMGGHEAGERASAAVVDEFARYIGRDSLALDDVRQAVARARDAVEELSTRGNGRAGTTLTGAVIANVDGMGYWLVLNIGDSRVYRLEAGELEQISVDHSVVQELIEAGELTPADAATDRRRNIITRAIGAGSTGEVDYWLFPAEQADRLLICSDGLTSEITDDEIFDILTAQKEPHRAAEVLVTAAVNAGGRDNVTVIVVDTVSVASHVGSLVETDEPDIADTRPREVSGGVH